MADWLCQRVDDIEDRTLRMELLLDKLGIGPSQGARLKGSTWEVSENQIAQWVAGTTLPLTAASSYVRFKDGSLEIRGGKLDIHTGESGARMTMDGSDMYAYDAADAETFHIDFTTGDVTLTGTVTAGAGAIGGWTIDTTTLQKLTANVGVILDSATPKIQLGNTAAAHILLDGANGTVGTSDFSTGIKGWQVNQAGDVEFNNGVFRGVVRTPVFLKDEVAAIGGTFLVAETDVLTSDATTASALEGSFEFSCEHNYFAANDYVRCKPDGVKEFWALVTAIAGSGPYTYTATLKSGDTSTAFEEGLAIVNYGPNGQGLIQMTATAANSPYLDIFTHAAEPWTTLTSKLRIGNLTGITDADLSPSGYGFYSDNAFLKGSISAASNVVRINSSGIQLEITDAYADARSYKFVNSSDTVLGGSYGYEDASNAGLSLKTLPVTSKNSILSLQSQAPSGEQARAALRAWEDGVELVEEYVQVSTAGAGSWGVELNGNEWIKGTTTELAINDDSQDINFRVEGNSIASLLFVDAGTDRVGINTATPVALFDVGGDTYIGGSLRMHDSKIYLRQGSDVNHYIEHDASSDMTRHASWSGWQFYSTRGSAIVADLDFNGHFMYTGNLLAKRSGTEHTGYIFVPLASPVVPTAFNGDSYTTSQDDFTVDTSATWSMPAGVKAIYATITIRAAAAGTEVGFGPDSTYWYGLTCRTQVANVYVDNAGIMNCDSNGDVYFHISANITYIYLRIWGYFI